MPGIRAWYLLNMAASGRGVGTSVAVGTAGAEVETARVGTGVELPGPEETTISVGVGVAAPHPLSKKARISSIDNPVRDLRFLAGKDLTLKALVSCLFISLPSQAFFQFCPA
jgi:hypothetical protein